MLPLQESAPSRWKFAAAPQMPELRGSLGSRQRIGRLRRCAPALEHFAVQQECGAIDRPSARIQRSGEIGSGVTERARVSPLLEHFAAALPADQCRGLTGDANIAKRSEFSYASRAPS